MSVNDKYTFVYEYESDDDRMTKEVTSVIYTDNLVTLANVIVDFVKAAGFTYVDRVAFISEAGGPREKVTHTSDWDDE